MATLMKLKLDDLPATQAVALCEKAERMGLTPERYVKQLIAQDLALDKEAKERTFAELSVPFQKGLAGLSEAQLDALARSTPRRKRRKR